jgi:hypothetical protein
MQLQTLYVYFKLDEQPRVEVVQMLSIIQTELAASCGVSTRLMRRRDDADTWMEVYEGIADAEAFSAALQAGLQEHGWARFGLARHEEWFVPL